MTGDLRPGKGPLGIEKLLTSPLKGPRLPPDVEEAAGQMLGAVVGLEILSRIFQPSFPGMRVFAVEVRLTPDGALALTLVGVARDGAPVFSASRTLLQGRDGALELHHGFDEVIEGYRSRGIAVDLVERELELLRLRDPGARITTDAEVDGRYVYALHGFVFADETDEGPPVRSARALEPGSDRQALIAAASSVVERAAKRAGLGRITAEAALEQFGSARTPWDLARVVLPGAEHTYAEGDDGELGVGALGREFLLSKDAPPWRGALYVRARDAVNQRRGEDFRRRKAGRAAARLERETAAAEARLSSSARTEQAEGLRLLGMLGATGRIAATKALAEGSDRKIAAIARRTLRQLGGTDLADRLLAFAESSGEDSRRRGLAYRVLAEYHPGKLSDLVCMLRVHPDARIQRGVIPIVAAEASGGGLASLLAANPWPTEGAARPGLLELRIELIERLTRLGDPVTLPALMAAFRAEPSPPPAEMLALSRALVAFPDPRAQRALMEVAGRFERPPIP